MHAGDEILYEVRGDAAIITINRPVQRNAMNHAACTQVVAAFRRFDEDASLRVAILTGAGDKAFCAGRDLKDIAAIGGAAREGATAFEEKRKPRWKGC